MTDSFLYFNYSEMGEDKETNVGKIISGYCNGFFGRDDYEDKVIVYETEKAICCKYLDEDRVDDLAFKDLTPEEWDYYQEETEDVNRRSYEEHF